MKHTYHILFVLTIVLTSCGKNNFADDILKMQSRPIDLSACEEAICYKDGEKTIYHNEDSTYKLIIYIDSLSCSPCYVSHMNDYEEIAEKFDSVGIRTVFIFEPEQERVESVLSALERFPTPLVALIIKDGVFSLTNSHLPSTSMLHSFLLNGKNEVVIVGNPVRNDKIKNLMLNSVKTKGNQ